MHQSLLPLVMNCPPLLGTTTLYSYLKRHPLILGGAKEMHYFDRLNLTKTSYKGYLSRWPVNREIRDGKLDKTEYQIEDSSLTNGGRLFEITPSYFLVRCLLL